MSGSESGNESGIGIGNARAGGTVDLVLIGMRCLGIGMVGPHLKKEGDKERDHGMMHSYYYCRIVMRCTVEV